MRSFLFAVLVVAGLGACSSVQGTEPEYPWWWPWRCPNQRCPCCPDDYCPKIRPLTCPVTCFGSDDYCPKPRPVTLPLKYCGVDDYCPKPRPVVLPCYPPWYTCPAPEHCERAKCWWKTTP
jgi:hypothetical protein